MEVNSDVVKALQAVVKCHWTAIEAYSTQRHHFKRWGYPKLAKWAKGEAAAERKHLRWVVRQLELFDVAPTFAHPAPEYKRHDIDSILACDLGLESEVLKYEDAGAILCRSSSVHDEDTARVFGHLATASRKSVEDLTAWQKLIKQVGIQNFLQDMM